MIRLLVLAMFVGIGSARAAAPPPASAFQALIDRAVADDPKIPGVLLAVYSPSHRLDWRGASGNIALGASDRLTPDQPFRLASVTKAYTAAAILRLSEQDILSLTDPIARHISAGTSELLRGGGYNPDAIRIVHLLSHTSGLVDHAGTEAFIARIAANGQHRWTRREQIALAMASGRPWGPPGRVYHYSDTGYIILGEIIERATGQTLAAALRHQIGFERLGLRSTWFESVESPPRGMARLAHQYLDSGEVDTSAFDPSFDLYGGGGLVSTTFDLTRFFRALVLGQVFNQRATLSAGLAVPIVSREADEPAYAALLPVVSFGPHLCWGKTGFWGSVGFFCPDIDLAVGLSVNRGPSLTRAKLLAELAAMLDAAWSNR